MCCPSDRLRAPPATAASVLDLSSLDGTVNGTCGTYDGPVAQAILQLSRSPADYPMKIILPALQEADPASLEACPDDLDMPHTAFGIAISTGEGEADDLIGGNSGRVLAVSVPPPWFFVSGGCGEACPYRCLAGYQEFGVRSCITLSYGSFGFATADPNAPSVEAVVDLLDVEGVPAFEFAPSHCCIYGAAPIRGFDESRGCDPTSNPAWGNLPLAFRIPFGSATRPFSKAHRREQP
jgi:hypothetical protein